MRTITTTLIRRCVASTAFALMAVFCGCDTIGQDLSDLTSSLTAPTPTEAVILAVDPHNPDNRRQGTLLLSNAPFGGNPPYLSLYRDHVANEHDPLVKAIAVRALAKHGEPADAQLISPHLTHDNIQVRWEAAKGLQRLHNPAVINDLVRTLGNVEEYADVRVAAACALGQYPDDRAFQGLLAALDARELAINETSKHSLYLLTGQDFGHDARAWLAWYNGQSDDPFAGQSEFLYPTYQRDDTWIEKLAFWSARVEEHPAPPAGLHSADRRSTYDDETPESAPVDTDG